MTHRFSWLFVLFLLLLPSFAIAQNDLRRLGGINLGERPEIDRRIIGRLGELGIEIGDLTLPPVASEPRAVHGYIRGAAPARTVVNGDQTTTAVRVFLPEVIVFLRDAQTNRVIDSTRTDLNGAFYFPPVRPGVYQVCQQRDGFIPGCGKKFEVKDKHLHLLPIDISPRRDAGVIYGDVRQADGYVARALIENANVNAFARVTLQTAAPNAPQVKVNNFGRYMLAGLPLKTPLTVVAAVEKESIDRTMSNEVLQPGLAHRFDIRLNNRAPEIDFAVALGAGGDRVRAAAPGETVKLSLAVKDRDNDAVAIRWVVDHGGGLLSDPDAAEPEWTLGLGEGPQSVVAVAYDGRGGYDRTRLTITTTGRLLFGGRIMSNFGSPVSGAVVTVNGESAITNSSGYFRVRVPDGDRFVFSAERPGFGEIGQVYDDPVLSGLWRMDQATTERHDPEMEITVNDRLHEERCKRTRAMNDAKDAPAIRRLPHISDKFGALHPIVDTDLIRKITLGQLDASSATMNRREAVEARRFHADVAAQRMKGVPEQIKEALAFARRDFPCGEGASVRIPAGVLKREDGGPILGDVDVSITTIDITAPDSMPGNWSAQLQSGDAGYMESYGAATVNIYDTAGNRVNLAAGASAEMTIPVPPANQALGSPPAQIPILIYESKEGIWRQTGVAELDPTGTRYIAKVQHFSAVNTDLIKQDQACIRMYSADITGAFDVEVIAPLGPGSAPGVRHRNVSNVQPINALYNLPSNTWVTIAVSQAGELVGTYAVQTVPQTGDDPNDPFDNEPTYDYLECTGGDPDANTLTLGVIQGPPDNGVDVFLKGFSYPAFALDDSLPTGANQSLQNALGQISQEYHDVIDPCGCRDNLDFFKETNNFSSGSINAVYANSADLGFGRNMNCRANNLSEANGNGIFEPLLGETADVVCYVTNYSATGVADGNRLDDEADYQSIIDDDPAFATVAMEYAAVEDATQCPAPQPGVNACTAGAIPTTGPKIMKFFTYVGDGDDDGFNDVQAIDPTLGLDDGSLILNANLDGVAARPIPQLCMVCHGGQLQDTETIDTDGDGAPDTIVPNFADPTNPASAALADLGSRFLPFDVESFTIVDAADPSKSKANQQAAFRDLNQIMVRGSDPGQPALDLIDAFYAANPNVFDGEALVDGWRNIAGDPGQPEDPSVSEPYVQVVGQVCRGCHISQVGTNINFESAAAFAARPNVDDYVCGLLAMPHARVTYEKFWLSQNPHMPGLLNSFGATHMAGSFTNFCENKPLNLPAGPLSYSDIQTIFDGNGCGGCHDAADPFGIVMNLTNLPAGHSGYNDLVDVNSTQVAGEKRVSIDPPPGGSTKADLSRLFNSVDSSVCGGGTPCMPLGSAGLSAAEAQAIADWINDGAAN